MLGRLLLLFILVPLIELILLVMIADYTAWWVSVGIVIGTAIIGTLLARHQGLATWRKIQDELAAGHPPTTSLLDGAMILFASALLLTPGVITDLFGISLLIPVTRRFYRGWLAQWFRGRVTFASHFEQVGPGHSEIIDSYVVGEREGHDDESPASRD